MRMPRGCGTGLVICVRWVSTLELPEVPKYLLNFIIMSYANKEGSRVHSQTAYLFLQWEMNGERKPQSPYSSSSVKQGPDSVVKKFCCEALNRYVRPHSEKLEIFTDYRFALVYHRHEKV